MKRFLFITLFIIGHILSLQSQDVKEYYFKFKVDDINELDVITNIISIDNVKENEVYAYALQHEMDKFLKLGYKIEYLEKEVPKSLTMATTVSEMANWDRYPTYEVYRQMMKNFETDYPTICKLDSIGTTNNGRKLYVLRITDDIDNQEDEPEFFYSSTMHGDETTGYILMLRLADSLLSNYGVEEEITNLIDSIDLYINPNANPDGTYYGGNNTVSNAIRSNGHADLNRDFPDPRTGANSPYQPETQAMMDFAENHHFVMSANFHGGASVMNYPWDTWYLGENRHADTEWFELICTDYVTTARLVYSNYMKSVTSDGVTHGATWYKIDGGRQDYMNYWHQCREVTIELSNTKLLPVESFQAFWNYNKQSLINYMKESLYGIRGLVTNSCQEPLDAMIWIINHDEENDSSMVFTDPIVGNYHRLIEPGIYDVVASSDGFINDTVYNIELSQGKASWLNFKLQSIDDSIAITTNINKINDTLFFDETKVIELLLSNDSNAVSTNYTIETESENDWISLNKNNGSIPFNEFDTVLISFNTDLLGAGHFYNKLIVSSDDCDKDTIPIHLIVKDTISTEITPNEIIDTLWAGNNKNYDIIIKNDGLLSLNYNILTDPSETNWISYNKQSGNILITERDTITVSIATSGLGFGDFNCDIIIEKESSTNDTIPVSIFVKDTISYTINPEFIVDTLNQDSIASYKIAISNTGYSTINYTSRLDFPTKSDSWITTNDTIGAIQSGMSDTIKLIVYTLNLNAGDYDCALVFNENNSNDILIPVSIHVNQVQSIIDLSKYVNIRLFPNPFSDYIKIQSDLEWSDQIDIRIYDISGKLVQQKEIHLSKQNSDIELSTLNLTKGIYLIRVSSNNKQAVFKAIKN